jgi:AraC-like DNA-binding protein
MAGLSDFLDQYLVERAEYGRHVIGFTLAGYGVTQSREGAHLVGPGEFIVKPAGLPYRTLLTPNHRKKIWSTAWFHLEDRPRWAALRLPHIRRFPSFHGKALAYNMDEYWSATSSRTGNDRAGELHPLAESMARLILDYLDDEIRRIGGKIDSRRWELERLWRTVGHDLSRDWKIAELAGLQSLSPRHFIRLCQQFLGARPHQILTGMRIAQAKELLVDEQYTLESIAVRIGFTTPFVLSHAFKRATGLRPSEYRARLRGR